MSLADPITLPRAGADDPVVQKFRRQVKNPFLIRAFLLFKMPLGFVAGLRVRSIDTERCATTLAPGWRTNNPFRSTYFAALSMAAELSCGALSMLAVRLAPVPVSMLIVGLRAEFVKRATARVTFTCEDGAKLFAAIRETIQTGEQVRTEVETVGRLADGTEVARITFSWSFKRRAAAG